MLVNSSLGGLFPVLSAGHWVSNFCPLTHWTSPFGSAVKVRAPVLTAQAALGVPAWKPSLPTKQFQSVWVPSVLFRTMLPSLDSKPLGLPLTTAPETPTMNTVVRDAATTVIRAYNQ